MCIDEFDFNKHIMDQIKRNRYIMENIFFKTVKANTRLPGIYEVKDGLR